MFSKKSLVAVVFGFASTLSWAGGYLNNAEITTMSQAYGGWILNVSHANPPNPDGCSQTNIVFLPTLSQYDEMYAILLAAYTANKKINIYVNGCHANGHMKVQFFRTTWNY